MQFWQRISGTQTNSTSSYFGNRRFIYIRSLRVDSFCLNNFHRSECIHFLNGCNLFILNLVAARYANLTKKFNELKIEANSNQNCYNNAYGHLNHFVFCFLLF